MSSPVWNYFSKPANPDTDHIVCPGCKTKIQYKGSTSGLLKHIKSIHMDIFKKLREPSAEPKAKKTCIKSSDDEPSAEIHLARSFCTSLIPFRFAADKQFKQFVNKLNPNYEVPSPYKVRRLIETENEKYIKKLKKDLKNVKDYVLITDGFSDFKKGFNFYSVHIVNVDDKFDRKMMFCGIRQLEEGSTTADVSKAVIEVLDNVGLSISACIATVTDGASTMKCLSSSHLIEHVHCGCHILNLVFKDFSKRKEVAVLLKKSLELANYLMRNKDCRKEVLKTAASLNTGVSLPQPIPETRWAYLYTLFNAYKSNYVAITSSSQMQSFLLNTTNYNLLIHLVELLQPIHNAIRQFESDSSFSSDLIPTFLSLKEEINENGGKFAKALCDSLDSRIEALLNNSWVLASCIADPRYAFTPDMLYPLSWEDAIGSFKSFQTTSSPSTPTVTLKTEAKTGVGAYLSKKFALGKDTSTGIDTEILKYRACLNTNRPGYDSNPLHFWSANHNNFPEMSILARRFLSAPASSAASERLFSKCSDIVRQKKRNRIKTSTMNSILLTAALSKLDENGESEAPFVDDSDFEDEDENEVIEENEEEGEGEEEEELDNENTGTSSMFKFDTP